MTYPSVCTSLKNMKIIEQIVKSSCSSLFCRREFEEQVRETLPCLALHVKEKHIRLESRDLLSSVSHHSSFLLSDSF